MSSWALTLLAIAIGLYVLTSIGRHVVDFLLKSCFGTRWLPSNSKSVLSIAMILFGIATFFSLSGDVTNANDFSLLGFFLLSLGIIRVFFGYLGINRDALRKIFISEWQRKENSVHRLTVPAQRFQDSLVDRGDVDPETYKTAEQCAALLSGYLKTGDSRYIDEFSDLSTDLRSEPIPGNHEIRIAKNRVGRSVKPYGLLFILALAFLLRLYHIDDPLVGVESWRQTATASVARNYFVGGYNLLYPQIDWGGDSSGYVEMEFPLYPFLVAAGYKLLGFSEKWGRLLSAIFWLVAVFGIHRLSQLFYGERVALWACFFMSFLPVPLYYSRAFMPESMMIMSTVLGIYYFALWIKEERGIHLFFSAAFVLLACIVKIPTLYIGLPLLWMAKQKYGSGLFGKSLLWVYVLSIALIIGAWYWHAHRLYLASGLTFGIWGYGIDKWGTWDILVGLDFWKTVFIGRLVGKYLLFLGLPLFLVGVIMKRSSDGDRVFDAWLVSILVYLLVVSRGNLDHEYYQLPFVLPAAVYMARAAAKMTERDVPNRIRLACYTLLSGMVVLSLWTIGNYWDRESSEWEFLYFTSGVQKKMPEDALALAVGDGDPTLLYYVDRKGWIVSSKELTAENVKEYHDKGARFVIGNLYALHMDLRNELFEGGGELYEVVWRTDSYFCMMIRSNDKSDGSELGQTEISPVAFLIESPPDCP